MLTDVHTDTAVFAKISEAKMHDKKILQHLTHIAVIFQRLLANQQFAILGIQI